MTAMVASKNDRLERIVSQHRICERTENRELLIDLGTTFPEFAEVYVQESQMPCPASRQYVLVDQGQQWCPFLYPVPCR